MYIILIGSICVFAVLLFIKKFAGGNQYTSKHVMSFIEKKYEDTWGMSSALEILGIHHLTNYHTSKRHIYLVVMLKNGKLVHSLSEVKVHGRNMTHKRMSHLERERFLNSSPAHSQEYSKLIRVYENY